MSSLRYYFIEDSTVTPLLDLNQDAIYAIEDSINSILHNICPNLDSLDIYFRFVSDVEALSDEDELTDEEFDKGITHGLLRCRQGQNEPAHIPPQILQGLAGKEFNIMLPVLYDFSWGQECKIRFGKNPGGLEPEPPAPGAPQ